ncbi:MAG: hypothetical protein QME60_01325 [Verrucomicrobiota bacterium]|nr:hypothetical protein [Verrucomicrobiota bacterium]
MKTLKGKPAKPTAPEEETEPESEEAQPDPEAPEGNDGDGSENPAVADAKRIAELESENARLRTQQTPVSLPQPAKVTAASLRSCTKDQRDNIEQQLGRPFDEILREVEGYELRNQNLDLASRVNVRDAIDDAQTVDPKVHNLRAHMKTYLDRLPLETRADPDRLKAEINHAKTYARGKIAEASGTPGRTPGKGGKVNPNPSPTPGGPDPEPEMPEEAIKSGAEYKSPDGKWGFIVGVDEDSLSAETRKRIQHKNDPNGVQFPKEPAPKFNRG